MNVAEYPRIDVQDRRRFAGLSLAGRDEQTDQAAKRKIQWLVGDAIPYVQRPVSKDVSFFGPMLTHFEKTADIINGVARHVSSTGGAQGIFRTTS